jgi:hypothetical protein
MTLAGIRVNAVIAAVLLGACTGATADVGERLPHQVIVSAAEFAFRAVDSIPAGITTIRFINEGSELHHLQVVRLEGGHSVDDLLDSMSVGNHAPTWVTFMGGPSVPPSGGAAEVTLDLPAGQYAMLCYIPSKDGVQHFMKGMLRSLTVTEAPADDVREPKADVRMVLDDYSFHIRPALSAGVHTIRVENHAAQPHEVAIVRLAWGRIAADVPAWFRNSQSGEPPFQPVGGAMELSPGKINFVRVDLQPGSYALICFVRDVKDGKSHVAHGMLQQVSVY